MAKFRYNNLDNVSTDKTLKEFRKWGRNVDGRKRLFICSAKYAAEVSLSGGESPGDHHYVDWAFNVFPSI